MLLVGRTTGLDDQVVAEARSLDPERAGDLVTSILEAELSRPTAHGPAIRAAHLARELQLVRAVPALVRCLERLPEFHPLHEAARTALARLGAPAAEALLAAFDRCRKADVRLRIADALSRIALDDDRIRGALLRLVEDDPMTGARHLAERGDWRAVPELTRALDRLLLSPIGDCDVCSGEHLGAIAAAITALGGRPSHEQQARIDEVVERGDAHWIPFEGSRAAPGALGAPVRRVPRPDRNAPCYCGSGKKYKKCHLEADERDRRH